MVRERRTTQQLCPNVSSLGHVTYPSRCLKEDKEAMARWSRWRAPIIVKNLACMYIQEVWGGIYTIPKYKTYRPTLPLALFVDQFHSLFDKKGKECPLSRHIKGLHENNYGLEIYGKVYRYLVVDFTMNWFANINILSLIYSFRLHFLHLHVANLITYLLLYQNKYIFA